MKRQSVIPPEHAHYPEYSRRSRRYRRKYDRFILSRRLVITGIILGITAGLFYAWFIVPSEQPVSSPHQLKFEDKIPYIIAIILNHMQEQNVQDTVQRLIDLGLSADPIDTVAAIACDLSRAEYVNNDSGMRAVQYMKAFYQSQGRAGCADILIPDLNNELSGGAKPNITPTPLPSLPTKTPFGTSSPTRNAPDQAIATTTPNRRFEGQVTGTTCDPERSGLIEVTVNLFRGIPARGEKVRARWDGGSDTFVTGLKTEFGNGYADFEMEAGESYILDMPGLSDPMTTALVAESCSTADGNQTIKSYRVQFVQIQ